jgi:Xaa-Pro aminopeptidase
MLMNEQRLFEKMQMEGLAAVVATAPENVTYSSGYWAMSQWIRRGPQAYVLTPSRGKGDPCIIASTGAVDLIADQEVWVRDVRRYGYFAVEKAPDAVLDKREQMIEQMLRAEDDKDAVDSLVRAIVERGLKGAKIGVDEVGITPSNWDKLCAALPDTKIVRAAEVFRYARAIKTPEEVKRLMQSARIAEKSIAAALAVARPGATEMDLARAFHNTTINEGAMPVLGCIGSGTRSAMSNVQPSSRKLEAGDVIRFDVGGRYMHYRADIARNGVLGEPSAKLKTYHKALCAGLDRAREMIKPGLKTAELFENVMETVRKAGLPHYSRHHVGHGIGLDGYDAPNITASSKEVFEAGMVICVETPYYELGFAGLQVEDTFHVTADGVESLMSTGTELRVV